MKPDVAIFDEQENRSGYYRDNGEWQLDFSTIPPRRYKEHLGYLRVYDSGLVEIRRKPHCETDAIRTRNSLEQEFGIRWCLKSETTGIQFFTPNREPLLKDHIKETCLLLDDNHGMALSLGWSRGNLGHISYYSPGARPAGGIPIGVKVIDYAAVRKLRSKIAPMVMLATSYRAMSNSRISDGSTARDWLRKMHAGDPLVLDPPPSVDLLANIACHIDMGTWNSMLRTIYTNKQDVPFLYFKEGA